MNNKDLIPFARDLRKNMTDGERQLWFGFLRGYEVRFLRQKIIGKYIADFYCPRAKLVIELDGSQHFEETGLEYDNERTEYLKGFGIFVLRFANNEVRNSFSVVCEHIDNVVKERLASL